MGRSRFAPPAIAVPAAEGVRIEGRPRTRNYQRFELTPANRTDPVPPAPDPEQTERNQLREQARREGYAQGLEEGRARGATEFAQRIEHLNHSLDELVALRSVLTESYRREMVELALAAAEALVQRELASSSETIQHLAQRALEALGRSETLSLHVHPTDVEHIREVIDRAGARGYDLSLIEDAALHPGDIRVDNSLGTVESVLHDRLARIRQLVLGELDAGTGSLESPQTGGGTL